MFSLFCPSEYNYTLWSHSRLNCTHLSLFCTPSVTAAWFLSTLCKHIQAISDCGSSSLTIWLYSSSVSGGLTGFTKILLPVPPQTEGNLEEEQLIDSVSTHPFAGGSQGKSGGARGTDWKTKHDSARGRYGTVKGWRVGWGVGKHLRLLNGCIQVEIHHPLWAKSYHSTSWKAHQNAHRSVSIFAVPVQASLPVIVWVSCLPVPASPLACLPAHPRPCYL